MKLCYCKNLFTNLFPDSTARQLRSRQLIKNYLKRLARGGWYLVCSFIMYWCSISFLSLDYEESVSLVSTLTLSIWCRLEWQMMANWMVLTWTYMQIVVPAPMILMWLMLKHGLTMVSSILLYTGCHKRSFLYFISLYFGMIGLGKQITFSKKVVSFNRIHYFHTCCTIFWLEHLICVLPRQRCMCASIFSSHTFFVFYSPNCTNSFLVFCEYHERWTP